MTSSKHLIAAVDFSHESVAVIMAEPKAKGTFQVAGVGEARLQGVRDGEITHLGDAVESVSEALEKARRASGARTEKVYFNYDDPDIKSSCARGSKVLMGEGEIQASDIREACETAERLVAHFERTLVYAKPTGYVIDERDWVANPVGVFGSKLEVAMHVLQARSAHYQMWRKLMQRCQHPKAVRVLSAWSTANGIIPYGDRIRRRLVWDLGRDFLNGFVFENNGITDYQIFVNRESSTRAVGEKIAVISAEWAEKHSAIEQVLVTGDLALEKGMLDALTNKVQIPVQVAAPEAITRLNQPRYASLVGLLFAADELEKKMPLLNQRRGIFVHVKDQALSFINDYF